MNWVVVFIVVMTLAAILALVWLVFLVRSIFRDSEHFDDDVLNDQLKRRNFFDLINSLAWWRSESTTRLFYQRDRKGRFRKVRRH